MNDNQIPDYITYGRTFKQYKWYKPILTIAVTLIIYIIFQIILTTIFVIIFGESLFTNMNMGYESMNYADAGNIYGFLIIFLFIPSIYIASKIVKDRPFSSYSSSRGGWDWKIFAKSLIVAFAVIGIISVLDLAIEGGGIGANKLTAGAFIIFVIVIPLQCIGEEYFFRGLIMQTLGSWIKVPVAALIIQTFFFAAVHPYNITGVVTVLIEGIILGFVAWKTNGLEANSALHTVNNIVTQFVALLGISEVTTAVSYSSMAMGIGTQLAAAAVILYIGKKYNWFGSKN